MRPFQPIEKPKEILFGPIHPAGNGYIPPVDYDLNQRTLAVLVEYCRKNCIHLTVRYLRDLEAQGLTYYDDVTHITGDLDQSIKEIDAADVIVSHQTFAYLAIARGKPTLMMGEDIPPHSTDPDNKLLIAQSWEKYKDIMAYPLDILAGDPYKQIERACKGSVEAETWRERFIGKPFDPAHFVARLEAHL
jgi:hypothetical protein